MRTAFTGKMAKEVFNIVNRRFVLLLFLNYRSGTGIVFEVPVSHRYQNLKKDETHP